jgi:hypothetical protein
MQIQFIYGPNSESLFVDMDSCPRKDDSVIIPDGEYKVGATEYILGQSCGYIGNHIKTVVWLVPR